MSDTHNIVILGGSYSALAVAHGLLKAIPGLKEQTGKSYKVTMITNSTHFWFSVGAPRAMFIPFPKDIMDSFIPIEKGFKRYPSGLFDLVYAEITGVDGDNKTVNYKLKNEKEETAPNTDTMSFDSLVLATGSKGSSPLYSYQGSHVPTLDAYKDIQSRLPSVKSIMIVGGGTAGTETAGEIGHLHGKKTLSPKDITILSGHERLLKGLRPSIGQRAQEILEGMGVKVEHNLRLTDSNDLGNGTTKVVLSDGSTRTVDMLIVAAGRQPASSYLPSSLLDDQGRVVCDEYTRVPSLKNVWVTGDMAQNSPGGLMYVQFAAPITVGNIVAELGGKGKVKKYKPLTTKETQFVPVGPNYGVGAAFGWWVPSAVVRMVKGKTMFFPNAEKVRNFRVFVRFLNSKFEHRDVCVEYYSVETPQDSNKAPKMTMLIAKSSCRLLWVLPDAAGWISSTMSPLLVLRSSTLWPFRAFLSALVANTQRIHLVIYFKHRSHRRKGV